MTYAIKTTVPVGRTVAEIQKVLKKAGAKGFAMAERGNRAFVAFEYSHMAIKMKLVLPHPGTVR